MWQLVINFNFIEIMERINRSVWLWLRERVLRERKVSKGVVNEWVWSVPVLGPPRKTALRSMSCEVGQHICQH